MFWEGDQASGFPKLSGETLSLRLATPPALAPNPCLRGLGARSCWWPPPPIFSLATMCPRFRSRACCQLAVIWGGLQSLYIRLVIFKTSTVMLSPKPSRELHMEADQIKTVPSTQGAGAEITPCNYNVVNM